jgi:serine/threonine-protein kinase
MDIYALGLVAFWVLTGRSPFLACRSEPADLNMLWAEMTAPLPPASQRARELGVALSPTMDSWFARALAVSPAQRFASVSEMSQALFALVGSSPRVPTMRPSAGMASPPAAMPEPFGQPDPYQQQQPFQQLPFQQQEAGAAYPQEQPPGMAQDVHGVPMPALPGAAPASEMDDLELFQKPKSKILVPAIVGGALALVAVIALVIWLVFGGEDTSSASLPAASSAAAIASTQEPESKPAVQEEAGAAEAAPEAAPEKPTDALVSFLCTPDCEQVVCGQTKVDNPKEGVRLEPGKYTCTATTKGYTQATDSFTVTAGEDLKREITLKKVVVQYTPPTPKPAKTCGTLLNPCK